VISLLLELAMKENPILNDINISVANGVVDLSRYTFLEPISVGHLAIACKLNNSLIDISKCSGNAASFLSRMNFYEYIGIHDVFGSNQYVGNNQNTLEINDANNSNFEVFDRVNGILSGEPEKNITTIERLLAELVTNVEMYADFGVVVGQVISRVLHLVVVDKGPGIVSHLRGAGMFSGLTDDKVILESLKKGVTSGRGRGFGLWQTHEVLKKNGGVLLIRSENQLVDGVSNTCYNASSSWLGTSVELRYNLDKPVDFNEILGIQDANGVSNEFGF